ncbi:hypothetical protein [Actinomycetospora flava]|uniref:Integrase-like protein n=1 Tax=Actinomycetospora flava TaxID=3129232 RepID=A0ABU8M6Q9_9PSEU
MAIDSRTPPAGAVIHSDRGSQFGSWAFTDRAKAMGLLPSMGSIADCFDKRGHRVVLVPHAGRAARPAAVEDTRIELANAIFGYLEI